MSENEKSYFDKSVVVKRIGIIKNDKGGEVFLEIPVSGDGCFDPEDEYLPMRNAIRKSEEMSDNYILPIEIKKSDENKVMASDVSISKNDEEYQLWIQKFSKVIEEVSKSKNFNREFKKIMIKIWINKCLSVFGFKRRLDLSYEYRILMDEVFIRSSLFNDDHRDIVEHLLKDNCVESIMAQRPSIDIELLKGLLKNTLKDEWCNE